MQHLDEGTIHTWIDEALDAEGAREVETHLASCEECARLAAEARGLVAASSRILTALDDVPGKVIPASGATKPTERVVTRRWPMPFWMRTAAAVVIVAGTSALVMTGKLNSPERRRTDLASGPIAAELQSVAVTVDSAPVAAPPPSRDLAAIPPRVAANQGAAASQPFAEKSARVAGPKPGRPGSRTESDQATTTTRALARTAAEVEQKALSHRVARMEVAKDAAVAGAGASLQMRDSTARRSNVPEMESASAAAGGSRPAATLERRAAPVAPSAERSRSAAIAPSASSRAISGAHPVVGCYSLLLSPWSGGTIPFGAPPARIELDSLTSVQEAIRGLNLVHPARGTASNGAPYAYWRADGDSVYITWRDDRRGVALALPMSGEVVLGTARTFSTSAGDGAAQTTRVEALRISCRE